MNNELHDKIAMRAYGLFERRGFTHGNDVEDWLTAEQEVLSEELVNSIEGIIFPFNIKPARKRKSGTRRV